MTRKRYIKLLMSYGESRNLANERAYRCQAAGITYAEDYNRCKIGLQLYAATRGIRRSCKIIGKQIRRVVTNIKNIFMVSLVADSEYPIGGGSE